MTPPIATPPASDTAETTTDSSEVVIDWRQDVTEDEDGTPHTTLTMVLSGALSRDVALGTYFGLIGEVENAQMPAGAIVIKSLWWAGAGDNIAVFTEKGSLAIKRQEIDETIQGDLTAVPWKTIATVALPAGVRVRVAGQ